MKLRDQILTHYLEEFIEFTLNPDIILSHELRLTMGVFGLRASVLNLLDSKDQLTHPFEPQSSSTIETILNGHFQEEIG